MLGSIGHHVMLTARAKTGADGSMFVWIGVAAIASGAALVFLSIAAFAWIANRYGAAAAGLALGGFYLLVSVIAVIACAAARRRTVMRARAELAASRASSSSWFDPRLLAVGVQVAQAIGWKRIIPLAAIGLLAAGMVRENMHQPPPPEPAE
jgi:hypothetical protein